MKRVLLIACCNLLTLWDYRELHRYDTRDTGLTVALRSRVRTRMRFYPDDTPDTPRERANGKHTDEREPAIWLSERAVAALKLATDVISMRELMPHETGQLMGEGWFVGGRLVPSEFEGAFVRVNGTSKTLGCDVRYVWRVPRWDSFLDFDLFQNRWEYEASYAAHPEAAARRFAMAVVEVARRQASDVILASEPLAETELPKVWVPDQSELAWRQVIAAAKQTETADSTLWWSSRRREAFNHWFRTILPCFAFAESGLSRSERTMIRGLTHFPIYEAAINIERRRHLRAVIATARDCNRALVSPDDVDRLRDELDDTEPPLSPTEAADSTVRNP
jgi:hypothetical protein